PLTATAAALAAGDTVGRASGASGTAAGTAAAVMVGDGAALSDRSSGRAGGAGAVTVTVWTGRVDVDASRGATDGDSSLPNWKYAATANPDRMLTPARSTS